MLVLASARTPRSPAPHHNPTACKVSRQSLDEFRLSRGGIVSANKFADRLARVRLGLTGFQCGPLEGLVIHSEDRTGAAHTPEARLRFYCPRQSPCCPRHPQLSSGLVKSFALLTPTYPQKPPSGLTSGKSPVRDCAVRTSPIIQSCPIPGRNDMREKTHFSRRFNQIAPPSPLTKNISF